MFLNIFCVTAFTIINPSICGPLYKSTRSTHFAGTVQPLWDGESREKKPCRNAFPFKCMKSRFQVRTYGPTDRWMDGWAYGRRDVTIEVLIQICLRYSILDYVCPSKLYSKELSQILYFFLLQIFLQICRKAGQKKKIKMSSKKYNDCIQNQKLEQAKATSSDHSLKEVVHATILEAKHDCSNDFAWVLK